MEGNALFTALQRCLGSQVRLVSAAPFLLPLLVSSEKGGEISLCRVQNPKNGSHNSRKNKKRRVWMSEDGPHNKHGGRYAHDQPLAKRDCVKEGKPSVDRTCVKNIADNLIFFKLHMTCIQPTQQYFITTAV